MGSRVFLSFCHKMRWSAMTGPKDRSYWGTGRVDRPGRHDGSREYLAFDTRSGKMRSAATARMPRRGQGVYVQLVQPRREICGFFHHQSNRHVLDPLSIS
jgi:hypothetical protein